MAALLTPDEVSSALDGLPGVHPGDPGCLAVTVRCESFPRAVELITGVAAAAEEMNHHPDVDLRYDTVHFSLCTHSEGGLTRLDLELARRIIELANRAGDVVLPRDGRDRP